MGIDIGAGILLGRTKKDIEESIGEQEDFQDWVEENGFEELSPYFDAEPDHCFYGVMIYQTMYTARALDLNDLAEECSEACDAFTEVTGLTGKVYLSPHVF